jgi:hypothetical protein
MSYFFVSKIKLLLVTICLFVLNGCIGIEPVYRNKMEESSRLPIEKIINNSHEFVMLDLKGKQEIMSIIGHKLKYIKSENGYEFYSYKEPYPQYYGPIIGRLRNLQFYGVVIYAIIPIPLLIPVGTDGGVLAFKDNQFKKSMHKSRGGNFMGCQFVPFFTPGCDIKIHR